MICGVRFFLQLFELTYDPAGIDIKSLPVVLDFPSAAQIGEGQTRSMSIILRLVRQLGKPVELSHVFRYRVISSERGRRSPNSKAENGDACHNRKSGGMHQGMTGVAPTG